MWPTGLRGKPEAADSVRHVRPARAQWAGAPSAGSLHSLLPGLQKGRERLPELPGLTAHLVRLGLFNAGVSPRGKEGTREVGGGSSLGPRLSPGFQSGFPLRG